jgi:hypothetical protein
MRHQRVRWRHAAGKSAWRIPNIPLKSNRDPEPGGVGDGAARLQGTEPGEVILRQGEAVPPSRLAV